MLKLYDISFDPIRPVPSAWIMCAKSKEQCLEYVHAQGGKFGRTKVSNITIEDIHEIEMIEGKSIIAEDGDY